MSDQNESEGIQQLREAAENGRRATSENADLKRRLAMLEAGVDPSHPAAPYFIDGYKGELTAEAIVAEATKVGVLKAAIPATPTTDEEEPPVTRSEPDEAQRQQDLLASTVAAEAAGVTPAPVPDPITEGYEKFHQGMRDGRTREDASAEVIHRAVGKSLGLLGDRAG